MNYRKLRIAWSVAWGIVAVLLIALWGRSYRMRDDLRVPALGTSVLRFTSMRGHLECAYWETGDVPHLNRLQMLSGEIEPEGWESFDGRTPEWAWATSGNGLGRSVSFPHWFLGIALCGIAGASWLPWRFSLRTLLVATTLIAVILGTIFVLSR